MTCARLDEVLNNSPSADALAHAQTCPECGPARAAWNAMGGRAESERPVAALRAAALAELRAHPTVWRWWWDVLVLLAIDFAIATGALALLNTTQATGANPAVAAVLVALMVVGAWAAIHPGAHVVRLSVVALAALAAMWVGLGGSGVAPDRPFDGGAGCAAMEAGLSVVPLLVVLWATSRFAWDLTRALVGGLSVGATGMFVLHLHCGDGSAAHLFAFHVLPWLAIGASAAVLRRAVPTRAFAA